MARIAHLLDHPGHQDSRVFRATQAQAALGHEVTIFALNRTGAPIAPPVSTGIGYVSCAFDDSRVVPLLSRLSALRGASPRQVSSAPRLFQDKLAVPTPTRAVPQWKRILGLAFWHRAVIRAVRSDVQTFAPDLIYAHDLTMLPTGAKLAQACRAKLIYDSHEYERSRNLAPSGRAEAIRIGFEARYIRRTDAVICVSDSIADQLSQDYEIARPSVVLNAAKFDEEHPYSRADFNLPETARIAGYVGSLQTGRGLEQAIEALSLAKDWSLLIVGSAGDDRRAELSNLAKAHGVSERVFLRDTVPKDRVGDVIAIFDAALIPIQKTCRSYDFSLPNKLFQSVAAGRPIIATPLSEIGAFIRHFGVGHVAKGFAPPDLAEAISQPLTPVTIARDRLQPYSESAAIAALQAITTAVLAGGALPDLPRLPHARA